MWQDTTKKSEHFSWNGDHVDFMRRFYSNDVVNGICASKEIESL